MTTPMPPQLQAAYTQVEQALEAAEKRKIDLAAAPWPDIEKGIIKLLGGPFQPTEPPHQFIALGLAAAFGARLIKEHQAFWFPSRESPEGAAIGFPETLVMLSPFGAVLESLAVSKLDRLEEIHKDIRAALGQAKFSVQPGAGAMRLSAADYQRLFDPGFVQIIALDQTKAETAWKTSPDRLALDLREALGRIGNRFPEQLKKQLEGQLVNALQRMEPGKPLIDQLARAPRLVELVGQLFGASAVTGCAPEEFWEDFVFPILFIGSPQAFPEPDGEELAAMQQGVDPFFLFLEVVPYTAPAPEEEGLMGAFPANMLSLPHPALEAGGALRLIKVGLDAVKEPLATFDPAKTKEAIARFGQSWAPKLGGKPVPSQPQAAEMLEAALTLAGDLKRIAAAGQSVCVRRLTEAEAAAEGAMGELRKSLQGPRIILA